MPLRDERDSFDREILDIIPERYDSDPDSHYARKGAHTRLILTVALGLLAFAALGVAARHIFFGEAPKAQSAGVPVIKADDHPIKTKPEDRGGMDVPNQDKLVYERMGQQSDAVPQTERLLPPPEQPQEPPAQPRKPSIKPAFPAPPVKDGAGKDAAPANPAAGEETAQLPQVALPLVQPPALSPAKPTTPPAKAAAGKTAAKAPAPAKNSSATPASAAAPAPAAPAKTATGGGWLVQLGALKTEAEARNEWSRVKGANKDVLGDYGSDIVRVDLGEKGIFWRLRAGPMDEGQARSICASLAKRSQGCIIARK
ncbi:SPOR domain-containing protein [Telmatospirillum siberiense]|uniref:SPOR domain-containing protein n=1 Tax=Telmatospirillum siberiense TaxID=382514 RepID=A0A2N3PTE9_9PROT|nr:SPOR domain-containing protein [Telmatospirillum siberiense]PKU23675.1 SPOR domain-containing protein [Telmatospirillum siberiense]